MRRKIEIREYKKANSRYAILTKMFSNFYSIQGMTVENAKQIIAPYANVIRAQLKFLAMIDTFGYDDRSGAETYGYSSDEAILGNLQYISDRFNCQFRLRWVYDLITLH
jgi:hypothetical protein